MQWLDSTVAHRRSALSQVNFRLTLLTTALHSYTGSDWSRVPLSFLRGARSSFPLPLGGEGRVRGAAGATSSLWVRPPSAFDSACAVRPPLLDPLPRRGRGIRKRRCAPHCCHSPARCSPHDSLPGQRECNAGMRDACPCRGESRVMLPQRGRNVTILRVATAAENHAPNEPAQDDSVTAICN